MMVTRWFLLASHHRGAVSYDKTAAGVSWRKWDGEAFTRANMGEEAESFRDVRNRTMPDGEHPSIHWNRSFGENYNNKTEYLRLLPRKYELRRELGESEREQRVWF